MVDLDQWIAAEIETAFAEQEGTAFVSGNGTNKPKGFLDYTLVAETSWTWGNIGYVATGVAGALPASNPSDKLIDLVYALKAGYRQNANWVMNRKTQAAIRKLKDADGNYLWQPPATPGQRAMLMGFPLVEAEDMPDIGGRHDADRLRRFLARLSGRRPHRRAGAARSVFGEALRAVLHDQARRRRRAGLRRDQAGEVRNDVREDAAASLAARLPARRRGPSRLAWLRPRFACLASCFCRRFLPENRDTLFRNLLSVGLFATSPPLVVFRGAGCLPPADAGAEGGLSPKMRVLDNGIAAHGRADGGACHGCGSQELPAARGIDGGRR